MGYTAVKPAYNRKTKAYDLTVVEDANLLLAHSGFMVYDDALQALASVIAGRLIPSWKPAQRAAVIAHLTAKVTA